MLDITACMDGSDWTRETDSPTTLMIRHLPRRFRAPDLTKDRSCDTVLAPNPPR